MKKDGEMAKIRLGFVSNSSSSSFVLFYRDASIDEIDDSQVHVLGTYLNEGRDYFRPDESTREYLKSHTENNLEINLVYEYYSIYESGKVNSDVLANIFPKNTEVLVETFEVDNWSTEDFESFLENYDKKD